MKPLYTSKEFEKAKSKDKLPCECLVCNNTFFQTKHEIQKVLNVKEKRTGDFCSKLCQNKFQIQGSEVNCNNCKKTFFKTKSGIKKTKNHFCSRSCSVTYNNTHKKHGTKRSKLEVYFEERLISLYPNLKIDFNKKDTINSELDIYIPSLRLAIELNGIFHYEPIFGHEKLDQIQNNDQRKFQACLEKNIELILIDVSSLTYFKPERANKFLSIILDILNQKLNFSNMSKNVLNS